MSQPISRRRFLNTCGRASALAASAMAIPRVHADSQTSGKMVIGEGAFRYEVFHHWPQLPDRYSWQTTHNVAVDKGQNLYVIHEGQEKLKDHPSIFVFDAEGKYIRSFGSQFQGGGHGLEVREERGEEFLYVTGYQQVKMIAKLDLKGGTVWQRFAPMASQAYAENEDTAPKKEWGRNRFMPTNFAFLDDGGFLLADGYGSFLIHRYDAQANWVSSFGGAGNGEGKFNTPHGIWIDKRNPGEPIVVVTDRAHHTLQRLTLDGKHLETLTGFGLPANVDTLGDLMVVPELVARVSLLDKNNRVVAQLGDDVTRIGAEKSKVIRNDPRQWIDGKFVHPHDACFNQGGDLFVAEWVGTGRVTKLKRVS